MSHRLFYCKGSGCSSLLELLLVLITVIVLAACSRATPPPPAVSAALDTPRPTDPVATLTPTLFQPDPTDEPLAARVNGEGITLEQYQAEQARYAAAKGSELTPEESQAVLNDLIDQVLLAQGAAEEGFVLDEAGIQARVDALANQLGSQQALYDWLAKNGYTESAFRKDLGRAAAVAWMRDRVAASVPEAAEQVHALQILVKNQEEAETALAALQSGTDFAVLAAQYDPVAEGELGWFPQDYLLNPDLSQAVFALEPGQTSDILQTENGFSLIHVLERAERPLTQDARLVLQEKALEGWLEQRRLGSEIDVE